MADLDTQKLRQRSGGAPRDPFGLVGQVVDDQFRIDAVIGEGGFSVVYRGFHLGLSEPLAIKCLKLPTTLGSAAVESFVLRFRDEGRILYKLSQGNLHIVRSIASGMTMAPAMGGLVPYTILEWLDGYSLAEELEARRRSGFNGRPLSEVVPLLDSAVLAVAYAHTQGVVHRDLNPGNIFFAKTREGMKAKVLDFGLAKVVSDHALELGPRAETLSHLQIFAPAYAAPEQMDKRLGPVGPSTDVYTIALVMLEVLTDRAVIFGDHLGEIMAKTLGLHRPTPRGLGVTVPDEIEALFASAVELDPTKRPTDAGVFWGTLKHAMAKNAVRGAAATPSAMSPLEAFNSLPKATPATFDARARAAPVAGGRAQSTPPPPSKQALGGTYIMNPQEKAAALGAPKQGSPGETSQFPRLASTLPLGEQAAEARRAALSMEPPPPTVRARTYGTTAVVERRRRAVIVIAAFVLVGVGLFFALRAIFEP